MQPSSKHDARDETRRGVIWLRTLAERAFPELDKRAKEKLSVDRFLSLLDCSDIALTVRQKKSKCLDDVVAATLDYPSAKLLSYWNPDWKL